MKAPGRRRSRWAATAFVSLLAVVFPAPAGSTTSPDPDFAVALPEGVRAVWDISKAHRETTPTRDRISLNGLWRWQPAVGAERSLPEKGWGFFKVPGSWPGITDYMQKDSQTVHAHPSWISTPLRALQTAWYERDIAIPSEWQNRRITVRFDQLNSYAEVYVDAKPVGEARFPSGEVDLTASCRPGGAHRLSLRVTAMPLQGVLLSYTDSASAREVKGSVARRGLCGDVELVSTPVGPRIRAVTVETSVRRGELTIHAAPQGLLPDSRYTFQARVTENGGESRTFQSETFAGKDLPANGRWTFQERWKPATLWDAPTPGSHCSVELTLLDGDGDGRTQDVFWTERFGFREFWIEGRDFILNGSPIHLSAVPLDNAQVGAAWAGYSAARESLERLQSFGINFVYTHNYDCEPGAHLAFEEILRAADDVGMLVALSQPHFSHYDWKGADADRTNGYARHAEHYARVAGNHPSVVLYAMSHNATGYNEDMNPDLIDGIHDARDEWANRNVRLALRAEAIVREHDASRIVYHHASGHLGPLHAINFYPNFAPIQELSDWFEHWATRGVKPVFLCEYGGPFTWDWTMYRGWYRGQREFGSAQVPWEFCLAEWNAQFLGDRAFPASEAEKANLRWEARQFREGKVWHRWDYPNHVGSSRFDERYPVFAAYITDNWRSFRTWGVSATSPWEFEHFWKPREGVSRRRQDLPVDWDRLQRPGFSADYIDQRYERMDLAFDRSDWIATPAAEALYRNNRPLLAYLGGAPGRFSSKDHHFLPTDAVEKSLIVINDSRRTVAGQATWTLRLPQPVSGTHHVRLPTGAQQRLPLRFDLPADLAPGRYTLHAQVRFDTGELQEDTLPIEVLPRPPGPRPAARIALFDPAGRTAAMLQKTGVPFQPVDASASLDEFDLLVVGKAALTVDGPAPDLHRVRDGLKVVVFEQTSEALERRLGFRVVEYGLRQVFPRVPDHPVLAGITLQGLRDWNGEATLLPPRLTYELRPRHGPTVRWCDIPVPRLWRCGNRGNVASVLIEKPVRGDFLPLLDGGYSLQYSPLLQYREGTGLVLFCQLDVTDRTSPDPAAETLTRNLLEYAAAWKPPPSRTAIYAGDPAGRDRLVALGFRVESFTEPALTENAVLILGPGCAREKALQTDAIRDRFQNAGRALALGLGAEDIAALSWLQGSFSMGEHLSTGFEAFGRESRLAGVGPADLHLREPRNVPRITAGARAFGDGVLAENPAAVFCQLLPWEFDGKRSINLKRTERRLNFVLSRLAANLGVQSSTPLLGRFPTPMDPAREEPRWQHGFYLDAPEEWDDPYRFFRW